MKVSKNHQFLGKREAKICDNCQHYSYNNPDVDKHDLRAWCEKNDKAANPWENCKKFKMLSD